MKKIPQTNFDEQLILFKYFLNEYGIDSFLELVSDTKKYILDGCCDDNYIEKYKKLGNSTNFFFKKTIYKVKKNG